MASSAVGSAPVDAHGFVAAYSRALAGCVEQAFEKLAANIKDRRRAHGDANVGERAVDNVCGSVRKRIMKKLEGYTSKSEKFIVKYVCASSKARPIGGVLDPAGLVEPLKVLEAREKEDQSGAMDDVEDTAEWAARADMTEDTFDGNVTGLTGLDDSFRMGDHSAASEAEINQACERIKQHVKEAHSHAARGRALEECLRLARACLEAQGKLGEEQAAELKTLCERVGQLQLSSQGMGEDAFNLTPSKRARRDGVF